LFLDSSKALSQEVTDSNATSTRSMRRDGIGSPRDWNSRLANYGAALGKVINYWLA
jgi:hypothetical protein